MVKRKVYLEQIRPFLGVPVIKVLTGIRRCGKSTILEMLRDELKESGVKEGDIVFINVEAEEGIKTQEDLAREITARLHSSAPAAGSDSPAHGYLLLDEVQIIQGWERVVNAFFAQKRAEIFITGSNSWLLSSELATLLSGRYVQFMVRPLSFAEYIDFAAQIRGMSVDAPASFIWDYIKFGGFPGIQYLREQTGDVVYKLVGDIFSTVILKDVIARNNVRNADILERLVKFLFDNTGNQCSARNIAGWFTSQGRKVSVDTILEYIAMLKAAFLFEPCRRYDIRGKKLLNVREKYYAADVSLIHALLGYDDRRIGGILENMVYGELRRRGYEVYSGSLEDREIDFVCDRREERLYVQVCYTLHGDAGIIDREFGNLLKIKDQHPKLVVSLDEHWTSGVEGVRHVYLPDFLLARGRRG